MWPPRFILRILSVYQMQATQHRAILTITRTMLVSLFKRLKANFCHIAFIAKRIDGFIGETIALIEIPCLFVSKTTIGVQENAASIGVRDKLSRHRIVLFKVIIVFKHIVRIHIFFDNIVVIKGKRIADIIAYVFGDVWSEIPVGRIRSTACDWRLGYLWFTIR